MKHQKIIQILRSAEIRPKTLFFLAASCLISSNCRAGDFSFESLKRLIEEKQISSVEALLPLLPASWRSKYALVFRSRSIQESSYQNPRAILYGSDASFVLSFNGAQDQKGFETLETMEFDEKAKEFRFREISFPGKEKGRVVFSATNPEKCSRCHGNDPRPIWDTHPLWPGVYGERYLDPLSPKEQSGITSFLAAQPKHPRYSALEYPELFAKKETFVPSTKNRYEGNRRQSPNEELSRFFSKLNGRRIVRQLRESPLFAKYRYAILAALDPDCDSIAQYLPETLKEFVAPRLQEFSMQSEKKNAEQEQLKRFRAVSLLGQEGIKRDSDIVDFHSLRFVAEYGMGIPTEEWSTALESDTYDFSAPQTVESELDSQLLPLVSSNDLTVDSLAALRKVSSSEKYCAYLRRQSEKQLQGLSQENFHAIHRDSSRKIAGKPVLLQKCTSCHQGDEGPAIAFDQPADLARSLNQGSYPRGSLFDEIQYRISAQAGADSMPRGLNITENERNDLRKYFLSLKKLGEEK